MSSSRPIIYTLSKRIGESRIYQSTTHQREPTSKVLGESSQCLICDSAGKKTSTNLTPEKIHCTPLMQYSISSDLAHRRSYPQSIRCVQRSKARMLQNYHQYCDVLIHLSYNIHELNAQQTLRSGTKVWYRRCYLFSEIQTSVMQYISYRDFHML